MSGSITLPKLRSHSLDVARWLRRGWLWLAGLLAIMLLFGHFFTIGINASKSLQHVSVFLVLKWDHDIKRGDYVAFELGSNNPYNNGMLWLKHVAGAGGDKVEQHDRHFFVNGVDVGLAATYGKRNALHGKPLEIGPTGTIPQGSLYVAGDHPDSLDSRYALVGWITPAQVRGRAIVLF